MTDKEKLVKLFEEFGIGFTETDDGGIHCTQGDAKISGYCGFSTEFTFTKDGSFVEMGAYE